MPYTTANGTATPAAVAQSAAAEALTSAHQDRLLRTAERIVRSLAPPSEETGADDAYKQAASDTEVQVFLYLVTTGENTLSSEALSGVDSSSYRSYKEAVAPIVADSMADWYVGLDARNDPPDRVIARVGVLRSRRR